MNLLIQSVIQIAGWSAAGSQVCRGAVRGSYLSPHGAASIRTLVVGVADPVLVSGL
jgi:hypothetical protein